MMGVARFDDFDRMVRNDLDGAYVLFEDYYSVDTQCELQRATIQQLEVLVKGLEAELEEYRSIAEREGAEIAVSQLSREQAKVKQLEAQVKDLEAITPPCRWTLDLIVGQAWETACGEAFCLEADGPVENKMKWCCYCGGKLELGNDQA